MTEHYIDEEDGPNQDQRSQQQAGPRQAQQPMEALDSTEEATQRAVSSGTAPSS